MLCFSSKFGIKLCSDVRKNEHADYVSILQSRCGHSCNQGVRNHDVAYDHWSLFGSIPLLLDSPGLRFVQRYCALMPKLPPSCWSRSHVSLQACYFTFYINKFSRLIQEFDTIYRYTFLIFIFKFVSPNFTEFVQS